MSSQEEKKQTLVNFLIHQHPNCVAEFDVTASCDIVKEARKLAIKAISKTKSLPGFRKGKAPAETIEHNFAQDIDRALQEELANVCLKECLRTTPLRPLNKETKVSFNVISLQPGEEARLSLKFETEPSIPEVDVSDFTLEAVEKPVVNAEKIEETIRQTLYFFADWQDVSDRAAEENDCVVVDVDIIETAIPQNLFTATRFEANSKGMAKWMLDLILGMKTGESREGISLADEDATPEEKEVFAPKKVRVLLKVIQMAKLPELTDEFVKVLGVQSVDELRQNVTSILNKQADAHVKDKEREQLSQYLVKKYAFDLPFSMVDREARFRMGQLFQDNHFKNYWQSLNQEEQKKSVDTLFEQSRKAIRMFYLCRKVVTDNKVAIQHPEETTSPLEVLMNPDELNNQPNTKTEAGQAEAFSRLILERAEEYLLDKVRAKKA